MMQHYLGHYGKATLGIIEESETNACSRRQNTGSVVLEFFTLSYHPKKSTNVALHVLPLKYRNVVGNVN